MDDKIKSVDQKLSYRTKNKVSIWKSQDPCLNGSGYFHHLPSGS